MQNILRAHTIHTTWEDPKYLSLDDLTKFLKISKNAEFIHQLNKNQDFKLEKTKSFLKLNTSSCVDNFKKHDFLFDLIGTS